MSSTDGLTASPAACPARPPATAPTAAPPAPPPRPPPAPPPPPTAPPTGPPPAVPTTAPATPPEVAPAAVPTGCEPGAPVMGSRFAGLSSLLLVPMKIVLRGVCQRRHMLLSAVSSNYRTATRLVVGSDSGWNRPDADIPRHVVNSDYTTRPLTAATVAMSSAASTGLEKTATYAAKRVLVRASG